MHLLYVVDIAVSIQKFPAAKCFKTIYHPPYMPDIAPPDFLLFPGMNSELPDLLLTQDSFTLSWEDVVQTDGQDKFTATFWQWMDELYKSVSTYAVTMSKNNRKI